MKKSRNNPEKTSQKKEYLKNHRQQKNMKMTTVKNNPESIITEQEI